MVLSPLALQKRLGNVFIIIGGSVVRRSAVRLLRDGARLNGHRTPVKLAQAARVSCNL